MRFKVPPNCSAVTHGGVPHAVSAVGAIEADGAAAPLFLAHGILPWPETDEATAASAPSAPTTRETLVAALAAAGVTGPYPKTLAALRRALREARRTPSTDAPPARR